MANYTKKAIMQAFEEMLAEKSFDKITVSALVARCEISSGTFYYHYRDIYDLLNDWFRLMQERFFTSVAEGAGWESILKGVMLELRKKSKLVYQLFDSRARAPMERFIFNSGATAFFRFVQTRTAGVTLPDELVQSLTDFFRCSIMGFLMNYIWGQMQADIDESVDRLSIIFNGSIDYIVQQAITDGGQSLMYSGKA